MLSGPVRLSKTISEAGSALQSNTYVLLCTAQPGNLRFSVKNLGFSLETLAFRYRKS